MFNMTEEQVNQQGARHTTTEIYHQPEVWQELLDDYSKRAKIYQDFLASIYEKHQQVKVILTGAGTSAFAGDTLAPELNRINEGHIEFVAIPTTDIVSNPSAYLKKDIPTIMVSFARSGNSPESVATVELGQKLINDFYQIVITCNKNGQLAKNIQGDEQSVLMLMSEKSNDKSLAMTSSFTSMVMAAYQLFHPHPDIKREIEAVIRNGDALRTVLATPISDILQFDFNRVVYLGSGSLGQLAHEASLKMLELTAGNVVSFFESSLGFRHGPKSVVDDSTIVVVFMSQDSYTKKYDMDILKELSSANHGMKIIALTEKADPLVEKLADWTISVNVQDDELHHDFPLGFLYIMFGQLLAMKKSMQLGITPDNPSPDGTINRVVKGVTIYDYEPSEMAK